MFGWFNRAKSKDHPAEAPSPSEPAPMYAENGRPIRPRLRGFSNREDATVAQRLQALEWAKEWTGNSLLPVQVEDLLEPLENTLIGKYLKAKDPARPIVGHAARALYLSAQETRADRTKWALPWVEFRLGPQEHPCQAAKQLANTLIPIAGLPVIPLPECDESKCLCWLRQVTKAEAAKRNST